MDLGLSQRLSGVSARSRRPPLTSARLREALPTALTHHRAVQPAPTRLLEAAALILLLVIGLVVNAVGVWILIALPMTAIVVMLLSDLEASRAGAGERSASGL